MTPAQHLSDRMPDVALGRSRWTRRGARHLAACADCRAEWAIVSRRAAGWARRCQPADPAVTAARVLERLASERARGLAARIVGGGPGRGGGLGAGRLDRPETRRPAPVPRPTPTPRGAAPGRRQSRRAIPPVVGRHRERRLELPLPELDSLPAEALDSMLRVLDEPLARVGRDDAPLGEAGDQELEQALAGLEG